MEAAFSDEPYELVPADGAPNDGQPGTELDLCFLNPFLFGEVVDLDCNEVICFFCYNSACLKSTTIC